MRSNNRSYTKLLIRMLRLAATELMQRGWDPHELLRSTPDDPVTGDDSSPGGIENREHERIKWLHSPERELILLELAIEEREREGQPLVWHKARRAELKKVIAAKNAKTQRARNTH